MDKSHEYLNSASIKLQKALDHLQYSFNKVQTLSTESDKLDDESLEVWESFTARFSRVIDLFLMRYIKIVVKVNDPGFDGSLRDYLNQAEKLKIIDDASKWMAFRELRNIAAHEYTDENLSQFLQRLRQDCPYLLQLKAQLVKR